MKKRFLYPLVGIIIVALCIIIFLLISWSPTIKAQLIIESGVVQVKHADGTWVSAENGMYLYQSDSVKTGNNTSASIILFERNFLRLDSNTEITLKEVFQRAEEISIKIQQDGGRIWNRVSKISGIDTYEVQTPVAIASVRGTSFSVQILTNEKTIVGVGAGVVNVSRIRNNETLDFIMVIMNKSITIYPETPNQPLEIAPFEKDDWVLQNLQEDTELTEIDKSELYRRIDPYIQELKEKYGVSDQELEVLIDGYLRGDFPLPSDLPHWIRDIIESS